MSGGFSAYITPKPSLVLVSSAATERNALISDDAEARKADIPIVQLNPGALGAQILMHFVCAQAVHGRSSSLQSSTHDSKLSVGLYQLLHTCHHLTCGPSSLHVCTARPCKAEAKRAVCRRRPESQVRRRAGSQGQRCAVRSHQACWCGPCCLACPVECLRVSAWPGFCWRSVLSLGRLLLLFGKQAGSCPAGLDYQASL